MSNVLINVLSKAPYFEAKYFDGEKTAFISSDELKDKWYIIFFYPMDFSFICPTEICGINDNLDEFNELNCEVICCSVDSIASHKAFSTLERRVGGLNPCNVKLLEDPKKEIARRFGVLIDHGTFEGACQRATFIIDNKGVVRCIDINDINVGRNILSLIDQLKELKQQVKQN